MSISNLLLTARDSLFAHRMAIDITGGNVANVNTPGYKRQCLELRSVGSTNTRDGNTQIGVVISRVEQIYNNHQLVGQTSLSDFFSH